MRPIVIADPRGESAQATAASEILQWYVDETWEIVTIKTDARRQEVMLWLEEHHPCAVIVIRDNLAPYLAAFEAGHISMAAMGVAMRNAERVADIYFRDTAQAVAFKLTFT